MATTLESLVQEFPGTKAITRPQFRAYIGISESTDWRIAKAGKYPRTVKIGGYERILLIDLAAYLDAGGGTPKKLGRPVGSRNKTTHAHAPA